MTTTSKNIAAIDLGSNSFRLRVVKLRGCGKKLKTEILANDFHTVRLGENLSQTGQLSPQAIDRGLAVCQLFVQHLAPHLPLSIRICGTEALRVATNASDFVMSAQNVLAHPIEILSPTEEAELTMLGCITDIATENNRPILVDVGGGSTELIFSPDVQPPKLCSLPIGALNITEKFISKRPESTADLLEISDYLRKIIEPALHNLLGNEFCACHNLGMLASGGTATSLAVLDLDLPSYQADMVQGHQMTASTINKLINKISKLPLLERNELPGLENRGEIILAGAMIYQTIMKITQRDTLSVSTNGLLAGILAQLAIVPN